MDGIKSLEKIKEAIWFLQKIDQNKYWDIVSLLVDLEKELQQIIEDKEEEHYSTYRDDRDYDYDNLLGYVEDLEAAIENCIDIMRNR